MNDSEHAPGPIPTPVLSPSVACAGRGEDGRLLFCGTGGGSIWVEVLLEAVIVTSEVEELRGDRGTVFKSGGISRDRCVAGNAN